MSGGGRRLHIVQSTLPPASQSGHAPQCTGKQGARCQQGGHSNDRWVQSRPLYRGLVTCANLEGRHPRVASDWLKRRAVVGFLEKSSSDPALPEVSREYSIIRFSPASWRRHSHDLIARAPDRRLPPARVPRDCRAASGRKRAAAMRPTGGASSPVGGGPSESNQREHGQRAGGSPVKRGDSRPEDEQEMVVRCAARAAGRRRTVGRADDLWVRRAGRTGRSRWWRWTTRRARPSWRGSWSGATRCVGVWRRSGACEAR